MEKLEQQTDGKDRARHVDVSAVSVSLGDYADDSTCFESRRSEDGPEEDHRTEIGKIKLVRAVGLIVLEAEVEVPEACTQR